MTDVELWLVGVAAVEERVSRLSPVVREELGEVVQSIRNCKERLYHISEAADASAICASCGGACCRTGKYHVAVIDVVAMHLKGDPLFSPFFGGAACPYLGGEGCMMSPAQRPFTCITFNCEPVEQRLSDAQLESFYGIERELRLHCRAAGRLLPPAMCSLLGFSESEAFRGSGIPRRTSSAGDIP